jgi:hypothetical protein
MSANLRRTLLSLLIAFAALAGAARAQQTDEDRPRQSTLDAADTQGAHEDGARAAR